MVRNDGFIGVRLPAAYVALLKERADRADTTVSALLRTAVEQVLRPPQVSEGIRVVGAYLDPAPAGTIGGNAMQLYPVNAANGARQ